jgi:hypothetical protein
MEPEGLLSRSEELAIDPYPEPDESNPVSLRFILMLTSHPRLFFPSGLFSSDFPTKKKIEHSYLPMRSTSPAHLIFLDLIILMIFGEIL